VGAREQAAATTRSASAARGRTRECETIIDVDRCGTRVLPTMVDPSRCHRCYPAKVAAIRATSTAGPSVGGRGVYDSIAGPNNSSTTPRSPIGAITYT
jgi:hypothetical protein